jgi:hypothetical protein
LIVLRRIFGLKRDEVTRGLRKLHNEELHNLYSSPSIIRMIKSKRMRWGGHVARMGRIGMHIGISGEAIWKETLGRPRCRWVDNINMDFRDTGWNGMDWIDLDQDGDQWGGFL